MSKPWSIIAKKVMVWIVALFVCAAAPPIFAQIDPAAVCLAMVSEAAHNQRLTASSDSFLDTLYEDYCEADGTTKGSSWDAGISAVIKDVPVSLTGGASDVKTEMTNFCKRHQSSFQSRSSHFAVESIVVEKALQAANQCLEILNRHKDTTLSYNTVGSTLLNIEFAIASGTTVDIRSVQHEPDVDCEGEKIPGPGSIKYTIGSGQTVGATSGWYRIACTRKAFSASGGRFFYRATGLSVDTNAGILDIFWPQDEILPLTTASQIQGAIQGLGSDIEKLQAVVGQINGRKQVEIGTFDIGDFDNQMASPHTSKEHLVPFRHKFRSQPEVYVSSQDTISLSGGWGDGWRLDIKGVDVDHVTVQASGWGGGGKLYSLRGFYIAVGDFEK